MIRIAVVEDEELYAEQLQNYISKYAEERKKQIKVTWFQDGEDIVSGYKGEYDIILLDIQICYDSPPEKVGVFSTEINKKMKQLFTKRGKLFLVSAEEPTCFAKITKNIQRNRDKLLKNDMKYCSEKKNHV